MACAARRRDSLQGNGPMTFDPDLARDLDAVARLAVVPNILRAVIHATGMRFAAVARVTEKRWVCCAVVDEIDMGLAPGGELELETTICNEIRQHRQPVMFGKASEHPQFATHPAPKRYGFESYISIPIFKRDGTFFGTLCAMDRVPSKLDEINIVRTMELFAELVATQLEAQERIDRADDALLREQDLSKMRDQFIAVLGHDLRTPLQSISAGTALLKMAPLDATWRLQLDRMQRSCERMAELTENILDFARGRLGGGIPLDLQIDEQIHEELRQVMTEFWTTHPQRAITYRCEIGHPVHADRRRVAQLLTNLLGNALAHGATEEPVNVVASTLDGEFVLCVHNWGPAIPDSIREALFEPFARAGSSENAAGLGLGLYIAAEIARAHRGTLTFESSDDAGTTFQFRMPLRGV
jgi:signal transduction histidine kinase